MNFLPVIVLAGGSYLLFGRKKKKKKKKQPLQEAPKQDQKELPESTADMNIYGTPDLPDLIRSTSGDQFGVRFEEDPSVPQTWDLVASPVDNSVELISQRLETESGYGSHLFIFGAAKPGKGALVFHYQDPSMAGRATPDDIVEIQTEIL